MQGMSTAVVCVNYLKCKYNFASGKANSNDHTLHHFKQNSGTI